MGFLANDTNNIILDAVLTNEGRKRLAANNGTFRIVQFSFSDDEVDFQKTQLINDLKDRFRYRSIEDEGNDPAMESEPSDVEDELEELKTELKNKGGRPKEGNTYGKDKHPYGRDPLGKKENQKALKKTESKEKVAKEYVNGVSAKRKLMSENGDFLDDANLIDE